MTAFHICSQITMNDLDLLPRMYAPLQLMFAEHCVEMEMKAASRARTKERQNSETTAAGSTSSINNEPETVDEQISSSSGS